MSNEQVRVVVGRIVVYGGKWHFANTPFFVDKRDVDMIKRLGGHVMSRALPTEDEVVVEEPIIEEPEIIEDEVIEEPEAIDFEAMTVAELKEYAKEHEIDLGDAKLKAEIIEALEK